MVKYQLSNKADTEVGKRYEYTILNFGLTTVRGYVSGLCEKLDALAEHQSWGNYTDLFDPALTQY